MNPLRYKRTHATITAIKKSRFYVLSKLQLLIDKFLSVDALRCKILFQIYYRIRYNLAVVR